MVRREIGNIPDTWDGCYFGRTLDVSMTTAGSRPISFEFPVNQPFDLIGNWFRRDCQISLAPPDYYPNRWNSRYIIFLKDLFIYLFPGCSTPCRMHYLNRKVCVRNDRAHSFSRFVEPTLGNQSASQPASHPSCLEYLHSESYKRSKKLRVFESAFPGEKGISPAILYPRNRQIYSIYE